MDIKSYYEFVLAQFAAESYWDNLYGSEPFDINNPVQFRDRLLNGANRYDVIAQLELEGELGPTRMTNQMADDFESTWEITTHLPSQISDPNVNSLTYSATSANDELFILELRDAA